MPAEQIPYLLQALGVAADLSGDHRKAQEFYRRTIAADPMSDGAANDLALSLALSGDYAQATTVLRPLADGLRSTIVEQVANGVSVRMAVLYLLLGGSNVPADSQLSEAA